MAKGQTSSATDPNATPSNTHTYIYIGKEHPTAGLEHVKQMALKDIFGGLRYFWESSKEMGNMPYPNNPSMYLSWFLSTNLSMTRVLQLINSQLPGRAHHAHQPRYDCLRPDSCERVGYFIYCFSPQRHPSSGAGCPQRRQRLPGATPCCSFRRRLALGR